MTNLTLDEDAKKALQPVIDMVDKATLDRVTPYAEMVASLQIALIEVIRMLIQRGALDQAETVQAMKTAANALQPQTLSKRVVFDQIVSALSGRSLQ